MNTKPERSGATVLPSADVATCEPQDASAPSPPNLPYGRQWIFPEDDEALVTALHSGWLTQGPAVDAFEEALVEATGARYAVAVSSGTAALHLAYLAAGVGPGDVVATSPVTFLATANAAVYCGGRPEFVDIDPRTVCLSPDALEERLRTGLRPKLVVPVHFGGLPCDMERLAALAERYGFGMVEDACHALGASYLAGGSWGRIGDCCYSAAAVFSFHPVKHITTGEGGAVVTNDPALADSVRKLRSHGVVRSGFRTPLARGAGGLDRPWLYEMHELGFNYRLTDLQCALGRSQLRRLKGFVERRKTLASEYRVDLTPLVEADRLALPLEPANCRSSWHLYAVRIRERRDEVYLQLRERGIQAQVHYTPVHLQPYYQETFGTRPGLCPEAEAYFEEGLSLPLFPAMSDADRCRVVDAVFEVLEGEGAGP